MFWDWISVTNVSNKLLWKEIKDAIKILMYLSVVPRQRNVLFLSCLLRRLTLWAWTPGWTPLIEFKGKVKRNSREVNKPLNYYGLKLEKLSLTLSFLVKIIFRVCNWAKVNNNVLNLVFQKTNEWKNKRATKPSPKQQIYKYWN